VDAFATAITCIDGRIQQPVNDWVKLLMNVRYVDLITEPGPDKALSEGSLEIRNDVLRKVWFSIRHHHSKVVVLVGHDSCAANSASREEHIQQTIEGVKFLVSCQMDVRVVGLWVNEWGSVDQICDTKERELVTSYL
jgi:carbonic anhydrase